VFQLASVASQSHRRKLNLNSESPIIQRIERVINHGNMMKFIAPLMAAGAAAPAIAAAPAAFAADHQTCNASGSGTVCQSPGNVQFNAPSPHVQFHPYGDQAYLVFRH
jgi:hypothetical protein